MGDEGMDGTLSQLHLPPPEDVNSCWESFLLQLCHQQFETCLFLSCFFKDSIPTSLRYSDISAFEGS